VSKVYRVYQDLQDHRVFKGFKAFKDLRVMLVQLDLQVHKVVSVLDLQAHKVCKAPKARLELVYKGQLVQDLQALLRPSQGYRVPLDRLDHKAL